MNAELILKNHLKDARVERNLSQAARPQKSLCKRQSMTV